MNILVINCGSSSLKFQLIDMTTEAVQAKGLCERIGIDGSRIVYTPAGGEKMTIESPMPTHTEAIKLVLDCLTNAEYGVIKSLKEINAVGHRVVHGGEKFASSTIITDEVIKVIEECNELAPLHNPANLIGINVCRELMPGVPMVGVFDTAFHQTMPKKAYLYGLPIKAYTDYKIRRYGFHGTSHSFVSKRVAEFLGKPVEDLKTIVCHLGNGARCMELIERVISETEIPASQFLPTHVNRNEKLFQKAIEYAVKGGAVDFTGNEEIDYWETVCDEVRVCKGIRRMLDAGVNPKHITISSDGQGSLPIFNEKGEFLRMGMGQSSCLLKEVKECVEKAGIPLETAISTITANPAEILSLKGKGKIREGYDADLCVLDQGLEIQEVVARGKTVYRK